MDRGLARAMCRDTEPDVRRAEAEIERALSPKRLQHVLGVRQVAAGLADRHGADRKKVEFAALLHDWAKETPEDGLMEQVRSGQVEVDAETLAMPKLFHAELAAVWIQQRLGVTDREILEAVRYHPTGAPGWGLVGQMLFVADFCEPGRHSNDSGRMLALAGENLQEAVRQVLCEKIVHLVRQGRRIHSRAIAYWNELVDRRMPSPVVLEGRGRSDWQG